MKQEAEKHAAEDAARKEAAEVRNQAEGMVFNMEKFLRDYGDKLPADAVTEAKGKIEKVNAAIASNNIADMRRTTDDLSQYMQGLGAKMYEGQGSKPNEDVVDAEYTET